MTDGRALRLGRGDDWIALAYDDLVQNEARIPDGASAVGRTGDAIPVRSVFDPDLPWVTVTSRDGEYRATIPADQLRDGGLLLVGSGVAPLGPEDGGPIRLVVSEGSTLCWNVKDVASLHATQDPLPDSLPEILTH